MFFFILFLLFFSYSLFFLLSLWHCPLFFLCLFVVFLLYVVISSHLLPSLLLQHPYYSVSFQVFLLYSFSHCIFFSFKPSSSFSYLFSPICILASHLLYFLLTASSISYHCLYLFLLLLFLASDPIIFSFLSLSRMSHFYCPFLLTELKISEHYKEVPATLHKRNSITAWKRIAAVLITLLLLRIPRDTDATTTIEQTGAAVSSIPVAAAASAITNLSITKRFQMHFRLTASSKLVNMLFCLAICPFLPCRSHNRIYTAATASAILLVLLLVLFQLFFLLF